MKKISDWLQQDVYKRQLLSWLLKVRLWLAEAGDTLPVMVLEEPGLDVYKRQLPG